MGQSQRYSEISTHIPLLFSGAQGIFLLSTERLSRSTLHLKEGGVCTLVLMLSFNCDVLHRRLGADSDKIPEGGTSTYILHLSGSAQYSHGIRTSKEIHAIYAVVHTGAEHYGNIIFRYSELTSQYHIDASIDVYHTRRPVIRR
jgi:hypothetical protein